MSCESRITAGLMEFISLIEKMHKMKSYPYLRLHRLFGAYTGGLLYALIRINWDNND